MYEDAIARIKEICHKQNNDCTTCSFYDKEDNSCIIIDEPSNWDINRIVTVLRKRDLLSH